MMEQNLKESSKMECSMDKVRREILVTYGFINGSSFLLSNDKLLILGKKFYVDGTRCEGEFKDGEVNG